MVRIANAFGRKVATAEEARKLHKVGTWYNSVDETLQKNTMPPNPTEFNPGFLTWPTDGKKSTARHRRRLAPDRRVHDRA